MQASFPSLPPPCIAVYFSQHQSLNIFSQLVYDVNTFIFSSSVWIVSISKIFTLVFLFLWQYYTVEITESVFLVGIIPPHCFSFFQSFPIYSFNLNYIKLTCSPLPQIIWQNLLIIFTSFKIVSLGLSKYNIVHLKIVIILPNLRFFLFYCTVKYLP